MVYLLDLIFSGELVFWTWNCNSRVDWPLMLGWLNLLQSAPNRSWSEECFFVFVLIALCFLIILKFNVSVYHVSCHVRQTCILEAKSWILVHTHTPPPHSQLCVRTQLNLKKSNSGKIYCRASKFKSYLAWRDLLHQNSLITEKHKVWMVQESTPHKKVAWNGIWLGICPTNHVI